MPALLLTPPLWGLTFAVGAGLLLWLVSLRSANSDIADILWGFCAAGVVDIAAWLAPATGTRAATTLLLVNIWAIRLCAYLLARHQDNAPHRARTDSVPVSGWRSLVQIFLLHVILIWFVASPPVAVILAGASPMGPLDYIGTALAACAILIEALADLQLSRFRADPANANRVLDRGLWRLSRHPNHFGEALLWWGLFLLGFSASGAWWLILSPILVTVLLLQNLKPMEEKIAQRRPAYGDYTRRVSAFVPLPSFK
jgi:steroid 5-alpha reductase family enzyme